MDNLFIIGIGGTGMRCIDAFTHLCAIGMFDNQEIDILTLDTDTNNGNKSKTEQLIERYIKIKGGEKNSSPTNNTFFSAKINHYRYAPEYSDDEKTYRLISQQDKGEEMIQRQNKALSDLFFDENVQNFRLDHGYRAQTHIGSHLMYHAMLNAMNNFNNDDANEQENELAEFLNKVYRAGDEARVFIFGSVFGGTGASSIPVIPRALKDAIKLKDKTLEISQDTLFGSTLLTSYFTFNPPKNIQLKKDFVVADSNKFEMNSQAALMFYEDNTTVQQTYSRMYHIGWPISFINYDEGNKEKETTTGGAEQKNPAHIVELMCACAAYEFFNIKREKLEGHEILYKSIEFKDNTYNFHFQDFFGKDYKKFMDKLGAFYATNFLIHKDDGNIKILTDKLAKDYNISDYKDLTVEVAREINNYFKYFGFDLDKENGMVIQGWLHQIQKSALNPNFLFQPEAYINDYRTLRKYNFGQLFSNEKFHFSNPTWYRGDSPYSKFIQNFNEKTKPNEDQKVEHLPERLLAHIYNTISSLHGII